jgi:nucleoside-diphosphate-sugar epimerase
VRILVTGNAGYVGTRLGGHLRAVLPAAEYIGFDAGYFARCVTGPSAAESTFDVQHWGDVRSFPIDLLDGVDAVVHLAAISNDPASIRFERITEDVNFQASCALAAAAKTRGVRAFVFASSCSIYGFTSGAARKETDALDPLTAYARSKVAVERVIQPLAADGFVVTSLRFATACGWSNRLRLDLVLNDFVDSALVRREIAVRSDGSPWRPLIDVADMCQAITWAIARSPADGGNFVAVNVGSEEATFQIKDIAEAVARIIPGTKVLVNNAAAPDRRSYRVDFSRYRKLAPDHQPQVKLSASVAGLQRGLEAMCLGENDPRRSHLHRLKALEAAIATGALDEELRWVGSKSAGNFA